MANWIYRCYDDGNKPHFWQRWYDANPQAQGAHDAVFSILEQLETWEGGNFKKLHGKQKELQEVKFKGKDKRQWRVFGKINQIQQSYLVLGIGYHKDSNYTPSNILTMIVHRLDDVKSSPNKAIKCERPRKQT